MVLWLEMEGHNDLLLLFAYIQNSSLPLLH